MENKELIEEVRRKAETWLSKDYDEATRKSVQTLLDNSDPTDLIDAFYKDLEFGTGGLRGIMGAGSNRMNKYTVGAATQGLSNYLKKEFANLPEIKVVIGYDCRNNSRAFAEVSADIFAANGIKVYLFDDLRPTPEVSYAIRKLGCQSGIILTASHNPKAYNGYKAYWDDGAQMIAPHDKNTIAEVNKIRSVGDIRFGGDPALIEIIGREIDELYLNDLKTITMSPESIKRHHDLKIVYTPIHGTGVRLIPAALRQFGFTNIINVPEQDIVSGDFPTVVSPNPEEPAAMTLAIEKAKAVDADLVLASDPDADRMGVAVKDSNGEWKLLNGNQTATLLTFYLIDRWKETGRLTGNEYIVKTIVTTDTLLSIANDYGVESYNVYTGFKWIADIIRKNEGKRTYICGGEESYGFLCEDFVRDKDAVSSCCIMAEMSAWAKTAGHTMISLLQNIYERYGYSMETGISVVKEGKSGAEEIEAMMKQFRENPLTEIADSPVSLMYDYASLKGHSFVDNEDFSINMPTTSNVLQYITENGTKISIRPSGTEPKIKFYVEVHERTVKDKSAAAIEEELRERIERIRKSLNI